ncbi:MAG TPA: hypothetical protein DCM87_09405 [Planctomycetes bacterium]|nr:hypothetical protein [Planctomycetota bacterium]
MCARKKLFLSLPALAALAGAAAAQVLIDEDFATDPVANNWQLNGAATWDAANARVVMTPAVNGLQSSMFYKELIDINSFKLEAKVKVCCTTSGTPADGMAITFIESSDPDADALKIGNAGGGLCVKGLTAGQQIVVEFDIYSNGACEFCPEDLSNHVGVEYSPIGFADGGAGDCFPGVAPENATCAGSARIGFGMYGNYTIDIQVIVQDALVAVDIGSADRNPPVPMRRVISFELSDYAPFTGLIGVTGSTGGLNAEQSIYSLKLTELPPGLCLDAPGAANRIFSTGKMTTLEWSTFPAYTPGQAADVAIEIAALRPASGTCGVPTALRFTETVPAGWAVSSISDGGTLAGSTITWNLSGASVAVGKRVTYKATPPAGSTAVVQFSGVLEEPAAVLPQVVPIGGDQQLFAANPSGFTASGFITKWLILGPFAHPYTPADNPGTAIMARDFLTDGTVSELTYFPKDGDVIEPDYGGAAASTGLIATPIRPDLNPGGIPAWLPWNNSDDSINFDDDVFSDNTADEINNAMAYALVYANNTTGSAIFGNMGVASDDCIQVILNGVSVWNHSIARGSGVAEEIQDRFPVVINPGLNRIMVKTFEGGGAFIFRLRIEDTAGTPIASGIELSTSPPAGGCEIPPVVVTRAIGIPSAISIEGVVTPAYIAGQNLAVDLNLSNVRLAGQCAAAAATTITEYVPAGWTAANITGGGAFAGGKITWTLTPAQLATTAKLSYTTAGPVTANLMGFSGGVAETGNIVSFTIEGESAFLTDLPYSATGFITTWAILGPYYPGGENPGVVNMQMDYLTDGAVTELDVEARPGVEVDTDYAPGAAFSQGLRGGVAPGINPNGLPMWVDWRDANEAINLQSPTLYNAQDQCMAYAVCYFHVPANQQIYFASGSDDSIQILLDDREIWINSIARGWGGGAPQDISPAQIVLAGWHRLMAKAFEGGGDWNFGVRMQNAAGVPFTSFKISTRPPTDCPPCTVLRAMSGVGTGMIEGAEAPVYRVGDVVGVSLTISSIRQADAVCPALRTLTIRETLPPGWTATTVSDGGVFAGGVVTWTLAPAAVTEGKVLTYKAGGPVTFSEVSFGGRVTEDGNPIIFSVDGETGLLTTGGLRKDGVIVSWLLLGPYAQWFTPAAGPVSADDLQRDFLTDAVSITEEDVMPAAGDTVETAYNPGGAASDGLIEVVNPAINPDGVPTWFEWHDRHELIDFQSANLYVGAVTADVDNAMAYAVAYLCVQEQMEIALAAGSDDALQVLVDENQVIFSPVLRGWGGFQDISPPIDLAPGVHRVMAKVFEAGGAWNFGVALREADGVTPLASGITVTLDKNACSGEPPTTINVLMGNVNTDKKVDIADAIALLGYLFGGGLKPPPVCAKAADANDDNKLDIADAIKILGYLFSQQSMLAPDHSTITAATNTCKPYAADGIDTFDGKPYFPVQVSGLPPCATPCVP